MSQETNKDFLVDLEIKFDRLITNIDGVKEKQEEMLENINKIKEAVYNPDEGLYARLKALESWKNTSSKMIWTLFTSMVGLISAFILKSF
tara:strand:+ start:605 stop:874 length:270 start_codon:yes stop_codon:yes gene_type:complete